MRAAAAPAQPRVAREVAGQGRRARSQGKGAGRGRRQGRGRGGRGRGRGRGAEARCGERGERGERLAPHRLGPGLARRAPQRGTVPAAGVQRSAYDGQAELLQRGQRQRRRVQRARVRRALHPREEGVASDAAVPRRRALRRRAAEPLGGREHEQRSDQLSRDGREAFGQPILTREHAPAGWAEGWTGHGARLGRGPPKGGAKASGGGLLKVRSRL